MKNLQYKTLPVWENRHRRKPNLPKVFRQIGKIWLPSLLATTCLFFIAACSRQVPARSQSIDILSRETLGLLHVRCEGVGQTRAAAETNAKTFVLNRLLYHGIPDADASVARLPMVENKSKLTGQQLSKLNRLMAEGEPLNRYFTEVVWMAHPSNSTSTGQQLHQFQMKVNYDLFRKDLEQEGIIRKFGL